jgi:hypothetical protein
VNFLIYCSLGEKFKKILYKSAKKLKDSTLSGQTNFPYSIL